MISEKSYALQISSALFREQEDITMFGLQKQIKPRHYKVYIYLIQEENNWN